MLLAGLGAADSRQASQALVCVTRVVVPWGVKSYWVWELSEGSWALSAFSPCLCAFPPELLECTWSQMCVRGPNFPYLSLLHPHSKGCGMFYFFLGVGRNTHTHTPSTHFWNSSELYLNTFSPVISVFSWCALLWSLVCPCSAAATRAGSVCLEDLPTLRSWKVSVVMEISLETAVVCLCEGTSKSVLLQLVWFVVEVIVFCITYEGW